MTKSIKRVYVDSSVVYGAPRKEFSQDSRRFWEAFRNGEFVIVVSDVLEDEMERAPQGIQNRFDALQKSQTERFVSTDESDYLATQYIAEGVVGTTHADDCRHIAVATLSDADVLVSWNFGDIVYRRAGYNDVNEKLGYRNITIQSPRQFLEVNNEGV
jgi:predicted nucleic acid-binding protein